MDHVIEPNGLSESHGIVIENQLILTPLCLSFTPTKSTLYMKRSMLRADLTQGLYEQFAEVARNN